MTKLTRDQAAIVGAYTGVLAGPFEDMQSYAEKLLGEELSTLGMMASAERLKEASKPDFLALCPDREDPR